MSNIYISRIAKKLERQISRVFSTFCLFLQSKKSRPFQSVVGSGNSPFCKKRGLRKWKRPKNQDLYLYSIQTSSISFVASLNFIRLLRVVIRRKRLEAIGWISGYFVARGIPFPGATMEIGDVCTQAKWKQLERFVGGAKKESSQLRLWNLNSILNSPVAPPRGGGVLPRILDRGLPRRFVNSNPI